MQDKTHKEMCLVQITNQFSSTSGWSRVGYYGIKNPWSLCNFQQLCTFFIQGNVPCMLSLWTCSFDQCFCGVSLSARHRSKCWGHRVTHIGRISALMSLTMEEKKNESLSCTFEPQISRLLTFLPQIPALLWSWEKAVKESCHDTCTYCSFKSFSLSIEWRRLLC